MFDSDKMDSVIGLKRLLLKLHLVYNLMVILIAKADVNEVKRQFSISHTFCSISLKVKRRHIYRVLNMRFNSNQPIRLLLMYSTLHIHSLN